MTALGPDRAAFRRFRVLFYTMRAICHISYKCIVLFSQSSLVVLARLNINILSYLDLIIFLILLPFHPPSRLIAVWLRQDAPRGTLCSAPPRTLPRRIPRASGHPIGEDFPASNDNAGLPAVGAGEKG